MAARSARISEVKTTLIDQVNAQHGVVITERNGKRMAALLRSKNFLAAVSALRNFRLEIPISLIEIQRVV